MWRAHDFYRYFYLDRVIDHSCYRGRCLFFMGLWPGKVASQNNHPQAEAIQIGSWVALLMGFALWPVVLVWAYTKPTNVNTAELREKIVALETRLSELESTQPESNQGGAS